MKAYNTFWNIILENEIIIPTIQRDFAYGREEANSILTKLLSDIKTNLDKDNDKLHLAFVYGKLDGKQNDEILLRNSENIKSLLQSVKEYANNLDILVDFDAKKHVISLANNVKFIPIDGQQRLTTLYLIHWYLAMHLKNTDALKILAKFSYATRVSSKEFCDLLCKIEINNLQSEIDSDFITNQEGYFKQWNNDPTVKNMLIVIDKISGLFKQSREHFKGYWNVLTKTDKICFDFFDLDNFQLTNELYVKMNSRGKKLSEFEKFKAWLYQHKELEHTIKKKIDIDWYDLFWKAQGNDIKDIDNAYIQWFKNLFLADFLKDALNLKENDTILNDITDLEDYKPLKDKGVKSTIAILRNSNTNFLELLQSDHKIKELFLLNVDKYIQKLDIIKDYYDELDLCINKSFLEFSLRQLLFTEQLGLNWWQISFQYAVVQYLTKNESVSFSELKKFFRIISNLIFNTAIDSPRLYFNAIESIDSIIKNCGIDILSYLQNELTEIKFFSNEQKKEEQHKAKIILSKTIGADWENLFIDAENQPYFYGQIGFILEINKTNDIEDFNILLKTWKNLFSKQILNEPNNFLFRGLLSIVGPELFIKEDKILRYPINDSNRVRSRNENWRRCLLTPENINKISNKLLTIQLSSVEQAKIFLQTSIDTYNNELIFIYPLIKNHNLLNNAKQFCLYDYNNNHKQIYVLNTTSLRGYYRELFTLDWYIQNKETIKQNNDLELLIKQIQYDINDEPGIMYKNKKTNIEYFIFRDYNNENFKICNTNNPENILHSDVDIFNLINSI